MYCLEEPGDEIQLDVCFPFGRAREERVYDAIDDCSRCQSFTNTKMEKYEGPPLPDRRSQVVLTKDQDRWPYLKAGETVDDVEDRPSKEELQKAIGLMGEIYKVLKRLVRYREAAPNYAKNGIVVKLEITAMLSISKKRKSIKTLVCT